MSLSISLVSFFVWYSLTLSVFCFSLRILGPDHTQPSPGWNPLSQGFEGPLQKPCFGVRILRLLGRFFSPTPEPPKPSSVPGVYPAASAEPGEGSHEVVPTKGLDVRHALIEKIRGLIEGSSEFPFSSSVPWYTSRFVPLSRELGTLLMSGSFKPLDRWHPTNLYEPLGTSGAPQSAQERRALRAQIRTSLRLAPCTKRVALM